MKIFILNHMWGDRDDRPYAIHSQVAVKAFYTLQDLADYLIENDLVEKENLDHVYHYGGKHADDVKGWEQDYSVDAKKTYPHLHYNYYGYQEVELFAKDNYIYKEEVKTTLKLNKILREI